MLKVGKLWSRKSKCPHMFSLSSSFSFSFCFLPIVIVAHKSFLSFRIACCLFFSEFHLWVSRTRSSSFLDIRNIRLKAILKFLQKSDNRFSATFYTNLHTYGLMLRWTRLWYFKSFNLKNAFGQSSHWWLRSAKWSLFTWSLRMEESLYCLSQNWQGYIVWVFWWTFSVCLFRELFQANVSLHWLQECFLRPGVCNPMWLAKLDFFVKTFSHCGQVNCFLSVFSFGIFNTWSFTFGDGSARFWPSSVL